MISWPVGVVLKVRVCGISELTVGAVVVGWGNNGRTLWLTENIKRNTCTKSSQTVSDL